jgi:peptide/nickel transport system substrate-binding protein
VRRFAIVVLAFVLAACGGRDKTSVADGGAEADSARFGGVAVIGAGNQVTDLNPLTSMDQTANQIQQFVLFTPLITYDSLFQPVPRWAKSWEVNADTTELTFRLRDDLFWHDGIKSSAHDVKFSYDLARNPEAAFPNPGFWTHYGEATVPDSFTFRVKLRPHADFLDPWRAFAPVPRHVLESVPVGQLRQHAFSRRPVGNGPFKFVSHAEGQDWIFEANPRFPAELGGRPYLDRLVYRAVPEPTTLLTELLTGAVDYYIAPTSEQAEQIRQSERVRLITFPARDYVYIAWNTRRPFFRDARVRRALAMAINRRGIIDGVLGGDATLTNATIPPFFWQFDPGVGAGLRYDPEGARRLLGEAGYRDRDGDGIIEDARGRPFQFTLKINQENQIRKDIAQVVQADLRKIGVGIRW